MSARGIRRGIACGAAFTALLCGCAAGPSGVGGGSPAPLAGAAAPPRWEVPYGRLHVLYLALEKERRRRRVLEQRLAQRERELARARHQLRQLRKSEASLRARLTHHNAAAVALRDAFPPAGSAPAAAADRAATEQDLRRSLADERRRRRLAEKRLAAEHAALQKTRDALRRLQQETAVGPYQTAQQALQEARREARRLADALQRERAERQRLAREVNQLRQRIAGAPGKPAGKEAALEKELAELRRKQHTMLAALQRDLDAARARERELARQVAELQSRPTPAGASDAAALRAENAALQARLEEEHRRNRELEAKLRMATRVTDLIFRMRAQSGTPPAGR